MSVQLPARLVLLGAHRWRRESTVQFASKAGLRPVLVLYETEQIPDDLVGRLAPDQIIRLSASDPLPATGLADNLSIGGSEWYVVGLDDYVCELAAELSGYSTARNMPVLAAKETLHKHLLRRRWNALCSTNPLLFPVPFRMLRFADTTFRELVFEEQDEAFDESVRLIVKPDALDASIGIRCVDEWGTLGLAVPDIAAEVDPLASQVRVMGIRVPPTIIVEHRIPRSKKLHAGAEFSAEFLSTRATGEASPRHVLLGMTQKYVDPDSFVEVCHCFPSESFPGHLLELVSYATTTLLSDLGVVYCISHWEYIVTEDGRLALVEAQLRPAGDYIMELIRRAVDRNPYDALFASLLRGEAPAWGSSARRTAAVFFPQPECPVSGRLSIDLQPPATELLGDSIFVDADMDGDVAWGRSVDWYARYMAVITEGSNFDAARRRCEALLTGVKVECHSSTGIVEKIGVKLP